MSLESGLTQATTHTPLWARRRIRLRFAAAFATGPTRQRHNLHGQHGLDEFALPQRAIHEWLQPVGCNVSDVNMRRCSMNLAVCRTRNVDIGHRAVTDRANARAADLAPIVREAHRSGANSLRAIAAVLNARNIPTPRGRGAWQAGQVSQLLARLPAEAE